MLADQHLQGCKHALISKWQSHNIFYSTESTYLKTFSENSTLDSKLLIIFLNYISNNDKQQHNTQTILSINIVTICSVIYKTKKNYTERCKSKLVDEWRERVGKGRVRQKDVKIFASSKNFVEGKKKNASCVDYLIKRSDMVVKNRCVHDH